MASSLPPVSNRLVLRYLWSRFWSYPWLAGITTFLILVGVATQLLMPWYFKVLIDQVVTLSPGPEAFQLIVPTLAILVAIAFVELVGWRIYGWLIALFQSQVVKDIEVDGFSYLLGHSYQFFSDQFTGSLVRRVRRISRSFTDLADALHYQFIPAAIILVGAIIVLGWRAPLMAWLFAGWSVILIGSSIVGSLWKLKLDVIRAQRDSDTTGALSDAVTNAVTIKLFTGAKEEKNRFEGVAEALRSIQVRAWWRGEALFAMQGTLMFLIHSGFFILGVRLWSQGALTVGDLVLIHTYLQLVFHNLWDIGRAVRRVYESLADAREMVEILELPYGVKDKRGAKALVVKKGLVEFKDITFAFHQTRKVLDQFSLTIAPGEKIALVGPSGAGKSTITKLLFRFYDVDGGKVLVDGQNIAQVTQDSLRRHVALVPQEPILFHRTLRENILYGRPNATEKEMIAASKKAHCHEFISALPDGYESFVGERGVKLSGGERQRIAIARAILKDAPILVLDEATSSLDSESESYIQEALRKLMEKKTVIVIAHRLSTIMQMDRIVVIEQGQVSAMGTHDELLAQDGTYRRLWDIQAGGFLKEEGEEAESAKHTHEIEEED